MLPVEYKSSRFGTSSTTFNGTTTFNNSGNASDVHISYDAGSSTIFNGPVFFNSNASNGADFWVAYNGDVSFNGNVTINSSTDGVLFGNGAGSVNMSAGNTVSIGGSGFTNGRLLLRNFTQAGNSPMTLSLAGTSMLQVGPNSAIGGNANFTSPQLLLNGVTFGGTSTLEKTGATDNASSGGNVFSGLTTITNSGSGYILLGNGSADQFNGVTTFNNTGSYRFYFGHNHSGQTTTFACNLTLNTNKSGASNQWSYLIAENGTSSISFGGAVTINCGGSFRSDFRLFNGAGSTGTYSSTTNINISNTDPSTTITMGQNGTSTYNGNITVSNTGGSAGITFNNAVSATSTLNGSLSITGGFSSGSLNLYRFTQVGILAHNLALTNGSILRVGPDSSFDGDVTFNSPQIYLNGATYKRTATIEKTGAVDNYSSGGNIFQGVTSITNSGSGEIFLGNTNGDSFGDVTTFNNTGSYRIRVAYNHNGQTTTFANNVIFNSNKSGGTDPWSFFLCEGTNTSAIFNGAVALNVAGTLRSDFRFLNGSGSQATFNGPLSINITNTDPSTVVTMGQNGTSTYNGNITVTNTGGSAGINFNNSTSASSTLNGSISIVSGFSSGSLNLYRFNQVGAINHNLALTNGAALRVGPDSEFDGNVNFRCPSTLSKWMHLSRHW